MQEALESVPGVRSAKANLDSKTAEVTFDPERAEVQDLLSALDEAGYEAEPR